MLLIGAEFVEEKEDIRADAAIQRAVVEEALDAAATRDSGSAPSHCTYSVGGLPVQASRIDYAAIAKGTCEAAEGPEGIAARGERQEPKQLQGADRDKSTEVDRLSFAGLAARLLVSARESPWWNCEHISDEGRVLQRFVNGRASKMPMTHTLKLVIY